MLMVFETIVPLTEIGEPERYLPGRVFGGIDVSGGFSCFHAFAGMELAGRRSRLFMGLAY